ncbi:hypothetical protein [Neptuniibacter sp. QD37_11]|uniref:hypothetical protein n=1 Tax=Neptuniibacter sp. QD37_11 TaxID=3398209 RepID=UPI0039F50502
MHEIKPNTPYALVNLQFAVQSTNPEEVADGLNETLRECLSENFIADYALKHTDNPVIVESSDEPEEGGLFDQVQTYAICIKGSSYNEKWLQIESNQNLAAMDQILLSALLTNNNMVDVCDDDTIFVCKVRDMPRHILIK